MKQSRLLPKANRLDATLELFEVFDIFSSVAAKYRSVHQKIPVLVIDNANKLPETILSQFQDFAKEAADRGTASVVFVSSEGRVPRRMRGTSILSMAY